MTQSTAGHHVRLATGVAGGAGAAMIVAVMAAVPAWDQDISINFRLGGGLTERVLQLVALMTALSLTPSALVMVTSFTRIVVVLSRTALGTASLVAGSLVQSCGT